jgi:hypothetical protein
MLRTLMRPARIVALAAGLVALAPAAACSTSCQDLGEKICSCIAEGPNRDACNNRVESQVTSGPYKPGASDEAYCESLLGACSHENFCYWLNTEEGKVKCGLAYPSPPDGGTPDGGL